MTLSLMAGLSLVLAGVPTCVTADSYLEGIIAEKARAVPGRELCQLRLYDREGDLDGDGEKDLAVVFSVVGETIGERDVQFLAVFLSGRDPGPFVEEAARRPVWTIHLLHVWAPAIQVEGMEYAPDDALCCPSVPVWQTFEVRDGKLTSSSRHRVTPGSSRNKDEQKRGAVGPAPHNNAMNLTNREVPGMKERRPSGEPEHG